MTHAQLVERAVRWLRSYRCGVVLSEQACVSGEMPDAIGWKQARHSVLVECKVTRADFLADRAKPFRQKPEKGVGSERFYLTPPGLVKSDELPPGWGLLELRRGRVEMLTGIREEPADRRGIPLRDESSAGQPAAGRGPHRAAEHHRLPEVEEPDG